MDRNAARVMAPDPRWFALHKLFMSTSPKRNPKKKPKDREQGLNVLDLIQSNMPHYPLDHDFEATLPDALRDIFTAWKNTKNTVNPDPAQKLGLK